MCGVFVFSSAPAASFSSSVGSSSPSHLTHISSHTPPLTHASSATFAWQAQHFVHLELLLRGRGNTLTLWGLPARAWTPLRPDCFCLAGATLYASGATSAWEVQHFVHLELVLRGRRHTLTLWGLTARAWTSLGTCSHRVKPQSNNALSFNIHRKLPYNNLTTELTHEMSETNKSSNIRLSSCMSLSLRRTCIHRREELKCKTCARL